jgi:hypothetical protein
MGLLYDFYHRKKFYVKAADLAHKWEIDSCFAMDFFKLHLELHYWLILKKFLMILL